MQEDCIDLHENLYKCLEHRRVWYPWSTLESNLHVHTKGKGTHCLSFMKMATAKRLCLLPLG